MTIEAEKITDMFFLLARKYVSKNKSTFIELHNLHDIHLFVNLNRNYSLHLQGYPGMSNENEMHVSARLRNTKQMYQERELTGVSIGNEHKTNVNNAFNKLHLANKVPYSEHVLESIIKEDISEEYKDLL
ncbi:hypothetical protein ACFL1H_01340 [Nanoarchaeota archaeon]